MTRRHDTASLDCPGHMTDPIQKLYTNRSKEITTKKKGKLVLYFEDENGNKDEKVVHNFESDGVGLA